MTPVCIHSDPVWLDACKHALLPMQVTFCIFSCPGSQPMEADSSIKKSLPCIKGDHWKMQSPEGLVWKTKLQDMYCLKKKVCDHTEVVEVSWKAKHWTLSSSPK